jgi:hypothetical protein
VLGTWFFAKKPGTDTKLDFPPLFIKGDLWDHKNVAVEAWTWVVNMKYRPFVLKGFNFRS